MNARKTDKNMRRKQASLDREATERVPNKVITWRVLKPVVAIAIGLVVVAAALFGGFKYAYNNYFAPVDPESTEQIEVRIESGSSLSKISKLLEEEGIIRNATVFKYYVDFSDMASKLFAGKFTLSPSMTFDDIIDVLKRPTGVYTTTKVTFREGWTIEEYAEYLVKQGLCANTEEFLRLANDAKEWEDYEFLSSIDKNDGRKYLLEGYLSPNTYEVYTNATEEDIIEKLLAQFDKVYSDEFEARAAELGMTMDEVVTLASIIEAEAKEDDFKTVSAVFHNRIKMGITLDSCATVGYFKGVKKLTWTDAELAEQSPFNTYKNVGLPVGPIGNPSEAAIKAALYPDETAMSEGYLFFCLGDPATGETVFAKTAEEHQANVNKYSPMWEAYEAQNNQ